MNNRNGLICLAIVFLLPSFSVWANDIPIDRKALKDITPESLAKDYESERLYRPEGNKQPIIGLALSGGGTKAAMFAHGVLNGLQDSGVLKKIDMISTVSGGSYVAYWYFTKQLESRRQNFKISQIFDDCIPTYWTEKDTGDVLLQDAMQAAKDRPPTKGMLECENPSHFRAKTENTRLDDPYRWQAHIVRWPDVLQTTPVYLDGDKQTSPEKHFLKLSFQALKYKARHLSTKSAVPLMYQYGIERTWGLNPKPRDITTTKGESVQHWEYTNDGMSDIGKGEMRVNPSTMQWSQLVELYKASDASIDEVMPLWILNTTDDQKSKGVNIQHIFEMTPFGYGSINNGYINNPKSMPISDLGTSVRASAGFADAQGLERGSQQLIVDNLGRIDKAFQWGVDVSIVEKNGDAKKIRLSDGGGAENLGLYSLLKRGLEDVIVVDAAQDVEGDMSNICTVRKALESENVKFKLEFDALHNLDGVCKEHSKRRYNVSAWKNPVVKGTVTWPSINGNKPRVTNIWLIKAAWDERKIVDVYSKGSIECGKEGQINCFLDVFYGHNSSQRDKKDGYMYFPQLSTVGATFNSSSYLFWGYRELGRMLASNLKVNEFGRIELVNPVQCLQDDLPRSKHHRPANFWKQPHASECKDILKYN